MVIVGDVHGAIRELAHRIDRGIFGQSIIQVGDFGLGFYGKDKDYANLLVLDAILAERRCHLYIIRGNHDDPWYWNECDWPFKHITIVKDYDILDIEDKTILFIGGGISIDRALRIEGKSYWREEVVVAPTEQQLKDIEFAMPTIVVSHVAPHIAWPHAYNGLVNQYIAVEKAHGRDLHKELEAERNIMDRINDMLQPKEWYYGHYHASRITEVSNRTFHCLGICSYWDTNKKDYINEGY